MIIWPARLAERYLTKNEIKGMLARVNDLIQSDRWTEALSQVICEWWGWVVDKWLIPNNNHPQMKSTRN